jgi:uncharacterized protein (DUF433 family)
MTLLRALYRKWSRDMKDQLIQSHPNIMMGKPVVAGTRITVSKVLAERAAEMPNAFSVISPGMVRMRPSVI